MPTLCDVQRWGGPLPWVIDRTLRDVSRLLFAIVLTVVACVGCDSKGAKSETDKTQQRFDCAAANLAAAGASTTIQC